MLPVNLKSVSPALWQAAGQGTPSLGAYGRDLVDVDKIGPAALVLAAAKATGDPRTPALDAALDLFAARQPGLMAWGGWDPFLDRLFNTLRARQTLRTYLGRSGSEGVQAFLQLREITGTGRFVPATRPGGQSLDALLLLTGLLFEGKHLSAPLQRELRGLAETAVKNKELGELETVFINLLSLGRRLDWG